ncbi:kinase-like domain-containing protein [Halteromyces radiatus]|uniref:kinase-like domain-containing protein n=1 Tax=Halteromyces radiatus TaxID=101107 RepID=UPI00221FD391|nr:kinase-like domain-containing protein [Halteromyces radiatus]KAI8089548.1 kinase-like domain-containing protein [Halteromyces radiatus]
MDVYGYRKQTYKAGLANQSHSRSSFEQRFLPTQISLPFHSIESPVQHVSNFDNNLVYPPTALAPRPLHQQQKIVYGQRQRSIRGTHTRTPSFRQNNLRNNNISTTGTTTNNNNIDSPYYSKVIEPSTPDRSSTSSSLVGPTTMVQPHDVIDSIHSSTTTAINTGFKPWSTKLKPSPESLSTKSSTTTSTLLLSTTIHLIKTFERRDPKFTYHQHRNPKRILTKPSKPAKNDGYDNEDHDYILHVNDILGEDKNHSYRVIDLLGQGTFGQVVKCEHLETGKLCSVKVIKNRPAFRTQSCMEVEILKQLNQKMDDKNQHHILRLEDTFNHKNHLCLVFELLSFNLYELIKQNGFKGLSIQLVRNITTQLLETLVFLGDVMIIHCDLKPENILLESVDSPKIKVIDFGSACHKANPGYTYIQSRFYRSPEVLLKCRYNHAIDMWSLGCIVAELFLGIPLFPGINEYDQLNRIMDMLGQPAADDLDRGGNTLLYFDRESIGHNKYQYKRKSREKYNEDNNKKEQPNRRYFQYNSLQDIIMHANTSSKSLTPGSQAFQLEKQMRQWLIDFLLRTLNLSPLRRWSPREALQHPFITGKSTSPLHPLIAMNPSTTISSPQTSNMVDHSIKNNEKVHPSKFDDNKANQYQPVNDEKETNLHQQHHQHLQQSKDKYHQQQYHHQQLLQQQHLQQQQQQQQQQQEHKKQSQHVKEEKTLNRTCQQRVESFETSPLLDFAKDQPQRQSRHHRSHSLYSSRMSQPLKSILKENQNNDPSSLSLEVQSLLPKPLQNAANDEDDMRNQLETISV